MFFYVYRDKKLYCEANEKITKKQSSCEKWERKKHGRSYDFSAARFDGVENDLKYITDFYESSP